jgi:SAM-dependent methyltransferase
LTCGHIFNGSFSDALAERLYGDVPLTNVPVNPSMHQRFRDLIDWLPVATIAGKRVLEIGGGSGHVARLLATTADSVVVFEPCTKLTGEMLPEPNIRLVSKTFPAAGETTEMDFVICRNVLEHVADPAAMMRDIRAALRDGGHAYLEVPDVRYILDHAAVPDLHLQHVQYFTRNNFLALAAAQGLRALDVLDIKAGHDFGVLFAAADAVALGNLAFEHPGAVTLGSRIAQRLTETRARIGELEGAVSFYGATPHGQVFFNALNGAGTFAAVLDDNPLNDGFAFYDRSRKVPVRPASEAAIFGNDAIIITAYLHDTVIAKRLYDLGFLGRVFTIRPAPVDNGLSAI